MAACRTIRRLNMAICSALTLPMWVSDPGVPVVRLVLCDASIRSIVKPIPACPIGWFPAEERYSHLDELNFFVSITNRNGAFGCPRGGYQITVSQRMPMCSTKVAAANAEGTACWWGNKQQAKPTAYKYANIAPRRCWNFVTSSGRLVSEMGISGTMPHLRVATVL